MANGGEGKSIGRDDFYKVLGVDKECTASELRNAYKKLALRWHPDRCSASGNSKFIEEAKKKFQAVQQAYSVLSDDNKRFLYDVGIYDSDDDENKECGPGGTGPHLHGCMESGMGDFMDEMAAMMSQTELSQNGGESFEQLQELFVEMFQGDIDSIGSSCGGTSSCSTSSSYYSSCESSNSNNLRTATSLGSSGFDSHFQKFSMGTGGSSSKVQEGGRGKKKGSRSRRS